MSYKSSSFSKIITPAAYYIWKQPYCPHDPMNMAFIVRLNQMVENNIMYMYMTSLTNFLIWVMNVDIFVK